MFFSMTSAHLLYTHFYKIQTYFPAFETCVRVGKVASIMCSYNAVNGVPSCANAVIQNEIVRNEWDFSGFIVSPPILINCFF